MPTRAPNLIRLSKVSAARGHSVLTGRRGFKCHPLPPDPHPRFDNQPHTKGETPSAVLRKPSRNSGSSRIGIEPPFQAHPALESIFDFRLICGLENAESNRIACVREKLSEHFVHIGDAKAASAFHDGMVLYDVADAGKKLREFFHKHPELEAERAKPNREMQFAREGFQIHFATSLSYSDVNFKKIEAELNSN